MTHVTAAWIRQQAAQARAPVTSGWQDGALAVFVAGRPANLKLDRGRRRTRTGRPGPSTSRGGDWTEWPEDLRVWGFPP